jgi:hypothetical protein
MKVIEDIVALIKASYARHQALVHELSAAPGANGRGGAMRTENGRFVEHLIDEIVRHAGVPGLVSKKNDPMIIRTANGHIKRHSVDRHIYLDDRLVHVVECKTYLDACYLERAYNDMRLFRKYVDPGVGTTLLALEDDCAEDAKRFYADDFDGALDAIYILMRGKRLSRRPMWKRDFTKPLDDELLRAFVTRFLDSIGHESLRNR